MTLNCESKQFLENCRNRILKDGEENKKGKGIAVLLKEENRTFIFVEYENKSAKNVNHKELGSFTLSEVFKSAITAEDNDVNNAVYDVDKIIENFKSKIAEIVGENEYKFTLEAYYTIVNLPWVINNIELAQKRGFSIEELIRFYEFFIEK